MVPSASIKRLSAPSRSREEAEERKDSAGDDFERRVAGRSTAGAGERKLAAGMRVEARYRGREKYYPGKILRCRINGKFDITYDDGARELGVARDMIRELDGGGGGDDVEERKDSAADDTADARRSQSANIAPGSPAKLVAGARVEARYRGRAKYFPA